MNGHSRSTLLGGVVVVACPLLCIGLPLLAVAGVGAGLALAVGGAALGGIALVALAAGAMLAVRRRRREAACCAPDVTPFSAASASTADETASVAEVARR